MSDLQIRRQLTNALKAELLSRDLPGPEMAFRMQMLSSTTATMLSRDTWDVYFCARVADALAVKFEIKVCPK